MYIDDKKPFIVAEANSKTSKQKSGKISFMEWNKIKSQNENKTNESRYFLESNFVRVNRLLVFGYPNQDNSLKMLKPEGIIFQKVLLRISYY